MVVNLNPSLSCFNESVNVLKFSSIANQIQIVPAEEKTIKYKIRDESTMHETVGWENGLNFKTMNKAKNFSK